MKKNLLLTALLVCFAVSAFSQADRFWTASSQNRSTIVADRSVSRLSFPKEIKLFNLNFAPLQQELLSIVDRRSGKVSTVISLPNAAGSIEEFEVYEASNFEPALQGQFPDIRAFSGKGITDKSTTLKLS